MFDPVYTLYTIYCTKIYIRGIIIHITIDKKQTRLKTVFINDLFERIY
jgi:hypothetical protein